MTKSRVVEDFGLDDIKGIASALADELGALGLVGRLELRPNGGDVSALAALDGWNGVLWLQPDEPADIADGGLWAAGQ